MKTMLNSRLCSTFFTTICTLVLLAASQAVLAADRVNVMPDRQVRPGVSLPVFGNATDTGFMPGDGSANGDNYSWGCAANPDVLVTDDGDPTGVVGNDRYIVENLTFGLLNGSTRELIDCTLTVDDGGNSDSDTVTIDIVDAADVISDTPLENLAVEVNIAIEDGLRAAYLAQDPGGSWLHGGFNTPSWICATTAFNVWAFANSGHLPTNDFDTDIYAEFVQKAIDVNFASSQVPVVQPHIGDPDGDGNGRMISLCGANNLNAVGYASPIATAGIIAAYSDAPGTLVPSGPFAGETYFQVIQDAIDWSAFAQDDSVAPFRGGWRYNPNATADTSVDSWHYVANEGFETVFGGSVLELVKQEAERRIDSSQSQAAGTLGQFGYTDAIHFNPGDANATTAGGLSGLVMVTNGGRVPPLLDGGALSSPTFPDTTTRKAAAVSWLGLKWDRPPGVWLGNRGNLYAMWTTARALRLNSTTLLTDKNGVVFDWETGEDQANPGVLPPDNDVHEGYFPFLVRTQAPGGHWAPTVNAFNWTQNLNTAWGILILQPTVFGPPNEPPDCTAVAAPDLLWPPNHKFVEVSVVGVTDPDGDPVTITIDSIFQDEPVNGTSDGNTSPDGQGVGTVTAEVRAERAGDPNVPGDGRVYHIGFSAEDGNGGACSGEVLVGVPHDQGNGSVPVDGGPLYDSTVP